MSEDPSTTLTCSDQCFPGVAAFSSSKTIRCVLIFPPDDSANSVSQSLSYCPPFFKQGPLKDICTLKPIDPGSIRAGTTLAELTNTLFDMNNSGYWCSSARWQAANNPDIAVMNSGAYNVRI
jgi:hypothetical protein